MKGTSQVEYKIISKCSDLAIALSLFLASCGDNNQAINNQIANYIADHPEQIVKSILKYRNEENNKQVSFQENKAQQFIPLLSNVSKVSLNSKGGIKVIEILDYNCSYCKSSLSQIEDLLDKKWSNVNLSIVPLPIISDKSRLAVLITRKLISDNGDYLGFAREIIKTPVVDDAAARKIAEKRKINLQDIGKYSKLLDQDMEVVKSIGINGTPTFIVNGKVITGLNINLVDQAIHTSS